MPSVSVVITTYNRAQLLPRAIESAQRAGSDLEVIVVDDCSTDETAEVCAKIPGIRYVGLSSNQGLAHARNVGIAESSSEFIAFLDDDDLRLPLSLDTQLRALNAEHRAALSPIANGGEWSLALADNRTTLKMVQFVHSV